MLSNLLMSGGGSRALPTMAAAGGTPVPSDAPPALSSGRAADLKSAFDFATNQATATGKLGGYSDQWFKSNLTGQDAARRIGVGNTFANETKSPSSARREQLHRARKSGAFRRH
jgi:hypothetical protein